MKYSGKHKEQALITGDRLISEIHWFHLMVLFQSGQCWCGVLCGLIHIWGHLQVVFSFTIWMEGVELLWQCGHWSVTLCGSQRHSVFCGVDTSLCVKTMEAWSVFFHYHFSSLKTVPWAEGEYFRIILLSFFMLLFLFWFWENRKKNPKRSPLKIFFHLPLKEFLQLIFFHQLRFAVVLLILAKGGWSAPLSQSKSDIFI